MKPSQFGPLLLMIWASPLNLMDVVVILVLKVAEDLLTLAYENGINLFDTAEVYNGGK